MTLKQNQEVLKHIHNVITENVVRELSFHLFNDIHVNTFTWMYYIHKHRESIQYLDICSVMKEEDPYSKLLQYSVTSTLPHPSAIPQCSH